MLCSGVQTVARIQHGPEPTLSDTAFTVVEPRGDKFVRKVCTHCNDPACASACPVGAIKKFALGPVVYDAGKCIGCRYCMLACPYGVPRYQWTKLAPYVKKCDLCSERVKAGNQPNLRIAGSWRRCGAVCLRRRVRKARFQACAYR